MRHDPQTEMLEKERKLAVITVTYNSLEQLKLTVDSVRAQKRADIAYVIVDGGSTDGTQAYVEEQGDLVTVFLSEPDNGIYDAMNKALALAPGEFVHFLNAGDIFASTDTLDRVIPCLVDTVDLVESQVIAIDPVTEAETIFPKPARSGQPREKFRSAYCHQAMIARRQRYIDIGGFDVSYRHFADFKALSTIGSSRDRVVNLPLPIVRFRLDGVSSDWRRAPSLYREKERLLTALGDGAGRGRYRIGLIRSYLYRAKRSLLAKLQ